MDWNTERGGYELDEPTRRDLSELLRTYAGDVESESPPEGHDEISEAIQEKAHRLRELATEYANTAFLRWENLDLALIEEPLSAAAAWNELPQSLRGLRDALEDRQTTGEEVGRDLDPVRPVSQEDMDRIDAIVTRAEQIENYEAPTLEDAGLSGRAASSGQEAEALWAEADMIARKYGFADFDAFSQHLDEPGVDATPYAPEPVLAAEPATAPESEHNLESTLVAPEGQAPATREQSLATARTTEAPEADLPTDAPPEADSRPWEPRGVFAELDDRGFAGRMVQLRSVQALTAAQQETVMQYARESTNLEAFAARLQYDGAKTLEPFAYKYLTSAVVDQEPVNWAQAGEWVRSAGLDQPKPAADTAKHAPAPGVDQILASAFPRPGAEAVTALSHAAPAKEAAPRGRDAQTNTLER